MLTSPAAMLSGLLRVSVPSVYVLVTVPALAFLL